MGYILLNKKKTDITMACNAPVICNHCLHLWGWVVDDGANVLGSDLLSSPTVPGECQADCISS